MKQIILCSLITFFSLSISSQTINVSPGKLEEAMTAEQMALVMELTLTGEMDNSDFYVIRDKMPNLIYLDLKNVLADTIPDQAFYKTYPMRPMQKIILPSSLKYIGEESMNVGWSTGPEVVFTGAFPEMAKTAFVRSACALSVSEDNLYCKMIDKYLCSKDGKVLYLAADEFCNTPYIPDGVETIAPRAFCIENYAYWGYLVIPSSVNYIGDEAFAYMHLNLPTRSHTGDSSLALYCCSAIPPVLGENVFAYYDSYMTFRELFVPQGSLSLYQSDEQWNKAARGIYEKDYGPSSIQPVKMQQRTIVQVLNGEVQLSSQDIIKQVEFIDIEGNSLYHENILDMKYSFCDKWISGLYFVKVTYRNGTKDVIKLVK